MVYLWTQIAYEKKNGSCLVKQNIQRILFYFFSEKERTVETRIMKSVFVFLIFDPK